MSEPEAQRWQRLQELARSLPEGPGVYRMVDPAGTVIYVGKARSLKRRVGSYFTRADQGPKTRAMVAQVSDVQVTLTHTEAEALILENNLIKELRPRYNVLLRDDKSYPYIYVSTHQDFPRLGFYRGARTGPGRYFGPFPSASAVRDTLNHLQKIFPVRQCEDSFFQNRSRPCLQYQIKRCTAPCVGYVDRETYQRDVRHAVLFLEGESNRVIDELVERMEAASENLAFEEAARLRDRIATLRRVQERQYVAGAKGDLDVVAAELEQGLACVQLFVFRNGQNLGNKTFFPRLPEGMSAAELLGEFLPRYYLGRQIPGEILLSEAVEGREVIAQALGEAAGHRVRIRDSVRGERRRWVEMALDNARHALQARAADHATMERRFETLQDELGLAEIPDRIECFDISHTRGEATVASCVVFNRQGPVKSDYRRFNIRDVDAGDDYAAMRQALERRFRRLKDGEGVMPDLLLIDGGKGQIAQARSVLDELQVNEVTVLGIAKGPERRPGEETLFLLDSDDAVELDAHSPALHLLQQVRDEAHRFAITGHRQRRGKSRTRSSLEDIPGLGPKRRQALLRQFGGLQGVSRAGVEDLAQVHGISDALARRIYETFHG